MQAATQTAPAGKLRVWAGRIISAIPVLLLLFSAAMKLMKVPAAMQGFPHFGLPEHLAIPLGILELACAVIYAIPRTSVLGAILVTGYLGGATAINVRIGEPWFMPVVLGVFAWAGLYLRDSRLRALLPLRSPADKQQ